VEAAAEKQVVFQMEQIQAFVIAAWELALAGGQVLLAQRLVKLETNNY